MKEKEYVQVGVRLTKDEIVKVDEIQEAIDPNMSRGAIVLMTMRQNLTLNDLHNTVIHNRVLPIIDSKKGEKSEI